MPEGTLITLVWVGLCTLSFFVGMTFGPSR